MNGGDHRVLPLIGAAALAAGFGVLAASALVARVPAGSRRPRLAAPAHRVDLTAATAAELAMLPDVGPSLAARIAADRAVHGGFGAVDELSRVKGVGPATLEALRGDARAGRMP